MEGSKFGQKRRDLVEWLEKALGLNPIHFIAENFSPLSDGKENKIQRKMSSFHLEMFPMDSLSKPYPNCLVKRGQKRLKKQSDWGQDDFKLYSILMIGRLSKNDCVSLLQNMSMAKIPFENSSLDFWESMIQSVILKEESLKSAQEIYELAENCQSPLSNPLLEGSIKVQLAFALGALYQNDLAEFTRLFREIRKKWWPLSRAAYTQILAAHCDYLYRFGKVPETPFNSKQLFKIFEDNRLSPSLQGIRSIRWIIKHMHLTGVELDSYQYHLLITGFCRANLSQKALRLYHWFIRKGGIPQPQLLDVLLACVCHFPHEKRVKTHQFGLETSAATLIDYFMNHFILYQLKPSLNSYLLVITFFSKSDQKKASEYYHQACRMYGDKSLKLCFQSFSSIYPIKTRLNSRKKLWNQLDPSNVWIGIVKSWKTFEYMETCKELGIKHPRLDWIVPESASQ